MFFDSRKLKMIIEIALKPTGTELQANPITVYQLLYICEKKEVAL